MIPVIPGLVTAILMVIRTKKEDQMLLVDLKGYTDYTQDEWYLSQFRQSKIIVSVSQGLWEDEMLRNTRALEQILRDKCIPAWADNWGQDANHE